MHKEAWLSDIDRREEAYFCGREKELAAYERFLLGQDETNQTPSVWSVYGTGGTGKSTLLDAFRRMAYRKGAAYIAIDGRDLVRTPDGFCLHLLNQLPAPESAGGTDTGADRCLRRLKEIAEKGPLTLAIDNYEELLELDLWLRDRLFQWLPSRALVVVASRKPLSGAWMLSPAWRERLRGFPLGSLNREQSHAYLSLCGIEDVQSREVLWEKTKGHPLALSLAASSLWLDASPEGEDGDEWMAMLVEHWLREVPTGELRQWIEAACALRYFDAEALSFVAGGREIPPEDFARLCGLSFVRRTARGWTVHDLMREAVAKGMRDRTPSRYKRLLAGCANLYMRRILEASRSSGAVWDVRECFYYIGDASIQWIVTPAENERYFWEPLSPGNVEEAERYLQDRKRLGDDPGTGEPPTLDIVKMEDVLLRELAGLDGEQGRLLRNQDGRAVGLSVIYSVNAAMLPYLEREPLAAIYLRSLDRDAYGRLKEASPSPHASFIRLIDIAEPYNPLLAIKGMELIFELMVSSGYIVAAPPPDPMLADVHYSLGFRELQGATHTYYDGATPTPMYVLDTRGEKLQSLFESLLRQAGLPVLRESAEEQADRTEARDGKLAEMLGKLTQREREAVELVLEGLSNADIARKLYVSEVTVKKHLRSAYQKLQARNRADLMRQLL